MPHNDSFPYSPGVQPERFNHGIGYNTYQESLWQAFMDTYYARAFGFDETRHPTPGFIPDYNKYEVWVHKAVTAWSDESRRDYNTRGLERSDLPEHLWLYLYERMMDAQPLKPNVSYGTTPEDE